MELRALFGYEWGDEIGGPIAVTVPTGDTVVDLSCAYSVTTPSNRSGAKRPRNFLGTSAGYSPRRLLVRRRRGGHEKLVRWGFVTEATGWVPTGSRSSPSIAAR